MVSEQSMERQHRTFNRLGALYRTMGDDEQRMTTTMTQAHLQIHPSIPAYQPRKGQRK
jgi:hypothetical protein